MTNDIKELISKAVWYEKNKKVVYDGLTTRFTITKEEANYMSEDVAAQMLFGEQLLAEKDMHSEEKFANDLVEAIHLELSDFGIRYLVAALEKKLEVDFKDKGPWKLVNYNPDSVELQSDDFEHDVYLSINGDFSDAENKKEYAQGLANKLNSSIPQYN